jgi:release factor glutamine methyltransferase
LRAAGCVFAEDEAALLIEAAAPGQLDALVARRCSGEPLEYILGWVEFAGRRLAIETGVFVPRRRTEFLAAQAAALVQPGAIVVDLCCGAGAIAATIAAHVDGIELYASDLDPAAVACARRNLPNGSVFVGDLYDALPSALRGRVDVLVANVPYVPSDAVALMPPEARDYEPRIALDGGVDGLDVARRVAREGPNWLAAGGHLLIETSEVQAPVAAGIFIASGLRTKVVANDEIGATVVIGQETS